MWACPPDPVDLSSPRRSPPLQRSAASALLEGSDMPRGRMKIPLEFNICLFHVWFPWAQAQDLIKDIGRRTNLFVPFSLTHETSWATSSITTFLRSALTFQVRKRVAVILREHLPDDFLPPPPIVPTSLPLSESDQGNLVENLPS